mmetsp:Transcript_3533/g.3930  ORF Transcript_3533/g.3930 Transcript_3533/m.3930 type:complete len:116 (-) Transcript_3533:1857-2204(-)
MAPKLARPAAAPPRVGRIPPRPGRVLRRPAGAREPVGPAVDAGDQFKDGHFVEADQIPVRCLTEGTVVVGEGSYWGAECKAAGKIVGLTMKGEGDVELQLQPEGTSNEDLLTCCL